MSDNCKHPKITAFSFEDTGEPAGLWACAYCGHKFVPIDLEMERDAERYSALRRGQHWSVIDGIGDDIIAEREACAKVVESFIDPEIESNTAYEDQVVDGMLWQVIQAIRDRGHYAASLPPLTTTEFSGADRRRLE